MDYVTITDAEIKRRSARALALAVMSTSIGSRVCARIDPDHYGSITLCIRVRLPGVTSTRGRSYRRAAVLRRDPNGEGHARGQLHQSKGTADRSSGDARVGELPGAELRESIWRHNTRDAGCIQNWSQ
jgi:hypothetical protein